VRVPRGCIWADKNEDPCLDAAALIRPFKLNTFQYSIFHMNTLQSVVNGINIIEHGLVSDPIGVAGIEREWGCRRIVMLA